MVEIVIVGLIIIYTLVVAVNIVLENGSCDNDSNIDNLLLYLKYVEVFILVIFVLEVALKVWGFGAKVILI